MLLRITLLALLGLAVAVVNAADSEIITAPKPGEEYVFVRSPKQRDEPLFETAHKIPEKLPNHYVNRQVEDKPSEKYTKSKTKLEKTELSPVLEALTSGHVHNVNIKRESGEGIVEIEEDKRTLLKDQKKKASTKNTKQSEIEIEVPLSKIENIKISDQDSDVETNPQMHIELEPMSQSGKLLDIDDVTTQKPILTTGAPATPRSFDVLSINLDSADSINGGLLAASPNDDIPLVAAGSEQKHSRIEIKKAPNGQDYEYEYVYYYLDDDEEAAKGDQSTDKKPTSDKKPIVEEEEEEAVPVHNSHDGPQNVTSNNNRNKSRYSTIDRSGSTTTTTTTSPPENNEVLPTSTRGRHRERNLAQSIPVEEDLNEERLPTNTRFPPRSRNINTTPSNAEKVEDEVPPPRQRGKARHDNHSEETTGQTRNKSRSNVKRPSLELVDSASFNTHASDVPVSQYKEIRSRNNIEDRETEKTKSSDTNKNAPVEDSLSEETIDERPRSIASGSSIQDLESSPKKSQTTKAESDETTEMTTIAAMDKVAFELYAILASENLNNDIVTTVKDEDGDSTTTDTNDDITTTELLTTTEEITTTTTEPTTTTTTTTTTPAPTTTVRGSKFRFRGAPGKAKAPAVTEPTTSSTTEASRSRGRYGNSRPSFGRGRVSGSTQAPVVEEKVNKQETSSVQSQKPLPGRSRFGSRSRISTPATTSAPASDSSASTEGSSSITRPRLRPSFNLRGRRPIGGSSTTNPTDEVADSASEQTSSDVTSTTARTVPGRARISSNIRPLRPGPRLTLGARTPSTTTEAAVAEAEAKENEQTDITTQPNIENTSGNALTRLRGRPRLQVAAAPRPKAAPAIATRRPNPLIARRKPIAESSEAPISSTEASSTDVSETSQEESAEINSSPKGDEVEGDSSASEEPATEPPRGLSSLLAGRRRLAIRKPGTIL